MNKHPSTMTPDDYRVQAKVAEQQRAERELAHRQAVRLDLVKAALGGVAAATMTNPLNPSQHGASPMICEEIARWVVMLADATLDELEKRHGIQ